MPPRRPFTREQRTTILYGMLGFAAILVILQLWLLTATVDAVLGGDHAIAWPAAAASAICFVLNLGLLRYFIRLSRPD